MVTNAEENWEQYVDASRIWWLLRIEAVEDIQGLIDKLPHAVVRPVRSSILPLMPRPFYPTCLHWTLSWS